VGVLLLLLAIASNYFTKISNLKKNRFLLCVYFSSGFILMIKLFTSGGSKIIVGLIVMIVTFCFAILALVDGLLLIKVRHKKLISIRCDIFKKGLFNFDMYIILFFLNLAVLLMDLVQCQRIQLLEL
jgi:hypothetical protein